MQIRSLQRKPDELEVGGNQVDPTCSGVGIQGSTSVRILARAVDPRRQIRHSGVRPSIESEVRIRPLPESRVDTP